ncbi:MAG: hypothetical protein ACYC4L_14595 [Chloroflexota bacterium]
MDVENRGEQFSGEIFSIFERVSGRTWSWLALGSIVASFFLFMTGKRSWSLFVGEWAPTFLLGALFFRLLGPSSEPGELSSLKSATNQGKRTANRMSNEMGGTMGSNPGGDITGMNR